MSLINVQKLSNGALISGGKLYIGVYLSNEPEVNPITVYTDAALTQGIDISTGADLDQDGFPLVNGVRTSLYVGVNFSLQIRDRNGASVWPLKAQQEIVPESVEGFNPADPQVITGAWGMSLSTSEIFWAGTGNPLDAPETDFFVTYVSAISGFSQFLSSEAHTANGSESFVRTSTSKSSAGGSNAQIGAGSAFFTATDNGEGVVRAIIDSPRTEFIGLPVYADDTAAGAGGLTSDIAYRTSTGELRIKL